MRVSREIHERSRDLPELGWLSACNAVQLKSYLGLLQEACESGSVFEGLLSDSLNIYATTASNAVESSWGTYCPGMAPSPPPEFNTCLGDLYSVAFLENRYFCC